MPSLVGLRAAASVVQQWEAVVLVKEARGSCDPMNYQWADVSHV